MQKKHEESPLPVPETDEIRHFECEKCGNMHISLFEARACCDPKRPTETFRDYFDRMIGVEVRQIWSEINDKQADVEERDERTQSTVADPEFSDQ